jgi:CRP-like cAMP-binding protein
MGGQPAAPPPPAAATGDACGCAAALDRAAILAEAADDPALASCCVRDLEDQARAERTRAALLAADRVEARVRAATAAVGVGARPPPPRDDDGDDLASLRAAQIGRAHV